MSTPSKRRSEGREAFESGYTKDECPYGPFYSEDWYEGYDLAQVDARQDHINQKHKDDYWSDFSDSCPWHTDGGCTAILGNLCKEDNCAPLYFTKNYEEQ